MAKRPEISVVIAVADAEDAIGHRVRAVARHLRALDLRFEILAVDAGSADNSFGVLALLAPKVPELRLIQQGAAARPFLRGAAEAQSDVVVLMDASAPAPMAPFHWAVGRLAAGRQAIILRGRYIVARRMASLPVIARASERFRLERRFERRFERAAIELGVDVVGTRPRGSSDKVGASLGGLFAPVLRLIEAA